MTSIPPVLNPQLSTEAKALHALDFMVALSARRRPAPLLDGGPVQTFCASPAEAVEQLTCWYCEAPVDPESAALVDEGHGQVCSCAPCANDVLRFRERGE